VACEGVCGFGRSEKLFRSFPKSRVWGSFPILRSFSAKLAEIVISGWLPGRNVWKWIGFPATIRSLGTSWPGEAGEFPWGR